VRWGWRFLHRRDPNVVPILEYDSEADEYRDSWSEEDEAIGIQIAQTFGFIELAESP
jgi:hypothetical protein